MPESSPEEVSRLLKAWGSGDDEALEELMPLVYDELRRRARRQMARENADHTLQTTALVNETFLRLADAKQVSWRDRAHFFALSARLMRRILVDHARARSRMKRGGPGKKVSLEDSPDIPVRADRNLLELDDALNLLSVVDSRKAKVVELRFFGGLSVAETAEVLNISVSTVMSDWKMAKVWLLRELDHKGRNRGSQTPAKS